MGVRVENFGRKFLQAAVRMPTERRTFAQIASAWNVSVALARENGNFVAAPPEEACESVDERGNPTRHRVCVGCQ